MVELPSSVGISASQSKSVERIPKYTGLRVAHERTGVFIYVCFGGREGKCGGSCRSVTGIDGVVASSSDSSRSGEGERDGGGRRIMLAFAAVSPEK